MFVVLASLLLAATPSSPPAASVPDGDIPRYLRGAELSGWFSARKLYEEGQGLDQRGKSIVDTPRTPAKGSGFETPEQAKARGEAMRREGQSKMKSAEESLDRFRRLAAVRFSEMTKTVSETIEVAGYGWSEGLLVTSLRAQKVARDAGMTSQHVLGAWSVGADGKSARSEDLGDDLRAAWSKAQGERTFLQAVPATGYRIARPAETGAPASFSADWSAPTAANQVALVWAEVHSASPTASVVFIRVADAHSLRMVASECFLTSGRSTPAGLRASVVMRDERSFLPRVAASGVWRLGYPREACSPLGAALLRHLCLRGQGIAVYAGEPLSDLLGGDARLDDQPNALWKIRAVAGAAGEFQVSSQQVGASAPTEVGLLSLRIEGDKPAAKPGEPSAPASK